ncbi:MAG: amidophosphoribosyltransferase [Hymenobacteraceae bacterium]|nr:amidophosphoribosyltransferase [Hymenobacteraceae bacterium]
MSDQFPHPELEERRDSSLLTHECGIALVRLLKPLSYYQEKYGTPLWGFTKLFLLMEKQHNRGQDGAGVASIKIEVEPGIEYLTRYRSIKQRAIEAIFGRVGKQVEKLRRRHPTEAADPEWLKRHLPLLGDVYLGHLRYGTHGTNSLNTCHPRVRENNWRSRSLAVAGNFNMTNVDELFDKLVSLGQHPRQTGDTVTVLEKIGHFLDEENQALFAHYKYQGHENSLISPLIEENLDLQRVLQRACKDFDGGYAMAGLTGYGAAFVVRDPHGIRPAYYYADDEIVVVASEKPAIKTAFGVAYDDIQELTPGCALLVEKDGRWREAEIQAPLERLACSFERIYFSRGNDPAIYHERKAMGRRLGPAILDAVGHDFENTIFSFIPNTAETGWLGLMQGLEEHLAEQRQQPPQAPTTAQPHNPLLVRPRAEKLVIKDAKLRTFITDNAHRDDLVSHVYDTTYGVVRPGIDTVVVLDDSIVRGTTLEKSIIRLLDRLEPKEIIIVSCAPQIRYPDCYGIDMSNLREFVAFRALLSLLKKTGQNGLLADTYAQCQAAAQAGTLHERNLVADLYARFTPAEISAEIAHLVTAPTVKARVRVLFQTIDDLHAACPQHRGDWYFTGHYPTPGGTRVVNRAFLNFYERKDGRAY